MAKLEVLQADVTKLELDAIANAANTGLMHGGGVAGAVRVRPAGTEDATTQCRDHVALLLRDQRVFPLVTQAVSVGQFWMAGQAASG